MRIEVFWSRSKKWFAGTVVAEDKADGTSHVAYENGKSFWHKLTDVKWRKAAKPDGAFSPSSSSSDDVAVRSTSRRRKPKQRTSSDDEVRPAISAAAAEVELSFDDSDSSAVERGGRGARGLSLNDSDDDDEEEFGDDSHASPKRRIVRAGSRASGRKTRSSSRIARGSADRSQATREVVRGLVRRRNTKRASSAAAAAAAAADDDDGGDDDEYNDDGSDDGSGSDSEDAIFERPTRKKTKKRERSAARGRAGDEKRRRVARASEPRRRECRAGDEAVASAVPDDDAQGAGSWAEQALASVGAGRLATEVVSVVADLRSQGMMSVIDRVLGGDGPFSEGDSDEEEGGSNRRFTLAEMMRSVDRDHGAVDPYMQMIAAGAGDASGDDSGDESVLSADQRSRSGEDDSSSASGDERAAAAAPTERRPHALVPLLRQLCMKREVQAALRSNCIADQVPTHLHAFGELSGCGNVGKLLTASRSTMVDNKSVDLFKMALAKQLEIRKMGGQGKRASLGALAVADRRNTDIYGAACRGVLHVRRLKPNEQRLVDRDWSSLDRKLEEDFSRRHHLRDGSDSDAFSEDDEWSAARGQARGRGGGGGGARGAEAREVKARTLKGYELIQSGHFKWRPTIGVEKPSPKMFQRIVCRVCQKWVKKPTHLATFFDDADDMSDSGGESGGDGAALRPATYGFARTRLWSQSPSQAESQSPAQSQALRKSHAPGRICCSDCGRSLAKGTELVRLLRAWGAFPLPAVSEANLITEQQRRDLCAVTTAIALHLYDDATEPAYLAENIEEWSRGSASRVDGEGRARGGSGERQLRLSVSIDDDRDGDFEDEEERSASFSQSQSQLSWGARSSDVEGGRASGGGAGGSDEDDPDGDVPLAQRWAAAAETRGSASGGSARGGSGAQSSAPARSNRAAAAHRPQRRASPGQSQLSWPVAGLLPRRRRRRVEHGNNGLQSSAAPATRRILSKRAPLSLVHHGDDDDVVDLT